MTAFEFVVMGLAVWRVSSVVASELGPGDVFLKLRNWLATQHGAWVSIGKGISCVWCLSVWVGFGWTVLSWFQPQWALWLAIPFALSAVAVMIEGVQAWLEQTQKPS